MRSHFDWIIPLHCIILIKCLEPRSILGMMELARVTLSHILKTIIPLPFVLSPISWKVRTIECDGEESSKEARCCLHHGHQHYSWQQQLKIFPKWNFNITSEIILAWCWYFLGLQSRGSYLWVQWFNLCQGSIFMPTRDNAVYCHSILGVFCLCNFGFWKNWDINIGNDIDGRWNLNLISFMV